MPNARLHTSYGDRLIVQSFLVKYSLSMFLVDREFLGKGRKTRKSWTGSRQTGTLYGVRISPIVQNAPPDNAEFHQRQSHGAHVSRKDRKRLDCANTLNANSQIDPDLDNNQHLNGRIALVRSIANDADEDNILLQSCHELLLEHPAIWQIDPGHIHTSLGTHTADIPSWMMNRSSQLAVATSTLVAFNPTRFPKYLCYKYNKIAVAKLYKYMSSGQYDCNDVLSAVSNLVLAASLQGDSSAARVHLTAAKALIIKLGGSIALDQQTARLLSFSDMHIAVETASVPFLTNLAIRENLLSRAMAESNAEVLTCVKSLKESTYDSTLPVSMGQAVHRFVDSAVALISALTSSSNVSSELQNIACNLASVLGLITMEPRPSESRSKTELPGVSTLHMQRDTAVVLIFWSQIIMCCVAEMTSSVSIRDNVLPMRNSFALYETSIAVKDGIKRWNAEVETARAGCSQPISGDWLRLFDIVASMEYDQSIKIAPLMEHVLQARDRCVSRNQRANGTYGNWIFLFPGTETPGAC